MRASDRAFEALREEIVLGDLAPGAVLTEVELAERLGVSRTPVREALQRLTAAGLVVPNARGSVVTEIAPADIENLYAVRISLEMQQARLAAKHADPVLFADLADRFESDVPALASGSAMLPQHRELILELDDALDTGCANPYLVDALNGLRTHLARIRNSAVRRPSRIAQAAREHAMIARAIAAGDGDLAANATHVHLAASLQNLFTTASESTIDSRPFPLEGQS